jgi:carbohydrate-selective porin OprB
MVFFDDMPTPSWPGIYLTPARKATGENTLHSTAAGVYVQTPPVYVQAGVYVQSPPAVSSPHGRSPSVRRGRGIDSGVLWLPHALVERESV